MKLQTELEGKTATFGFVKDSLCNLGYHFGGNWDYHCGSFDSNLWREGGETIYLRIPFCVTKGMLDNHDAYIEFETPYVIKHVAHVGLDHDSSSLISASFNQFQEPIDKDGYIEDKSRWEQVGEQAVQQIVDTIAFN